MNFLIQSQKFWMPFSVLVNGLAEFEKNLLNFSVLVLLADNNSKKLIFLKKIKTGLNESC